MGKKILFLVFCLISSVCAETRFQQVSSKQMYKDIPGCENYEYDARLTNLRNARGSTKVQNIPWWGSTKMGGRPLIRLILVN